MMLGERLGLESGEGRWLAIAVIGHAALFALLSAQFLAQPRAIRPTESPVEVSLVDAIGLVAQAPSQTEPPAQSRAPDPGRPEDAPPPAASPAAPAPDPSPKAAAAPPSPAPQAATPAPAKPPPRAAAKPDASPAKTSAAAAATTPPAKTPAKGSKADASKARPTGSRLDSIFANGLSDAPSKSKTVAPPKAAVIDAQALAGIQDAIRRQLQPCADRQVNPGPGANQIVTVLNLRLNRDGTLAALPTVIRQTGVDRDNDRYAERVIDLGIAAFKGCSPLRLPPDYYQTANGGWSNINYNWQLR